MDILLIIIGAVLVVALLVFLFQRIGKRRQISRLEDVSGERRQRAEAHEVSAAQLESELERERTQASQHREAAREAEQKLAEKTGR